MNIQNQFDKIIAFLLTLSIASLIVRKGEIMVTFIPKPFEAILMVIIIVFIIGVISRKINIKELIALFPPKIFLAIFGLVASTIVGWLITILLKGVPLNLVMIFDFGRLIVSLLIFIFVIAYVRKYPDLLKYFFFALLAPIIYIIFIFLPNIIIKYGIAQTDGRFYGFMNNPATVSKLILISLLFSFSLYLFEQKKRWLKACFFIMTVGLMSLIFWSGTRSALLGAGIGFLLVMFLYIKYNFSWRNILTAFASAFLILFLGFLVTPNLSKKIIINRTLTQYADAIPIPQLSEMSVGDVFKKDIGAKFTSFSEPRLSIWPYFVKKIVTNPLGMGPAYYTHTFVRMGLDGNPESYIFGAHNSFMEVMLYGGVVAIVSFMFLIFMAIKNLALAIKNNSDKKIPVALLGALVALSIALCFDDNFRIAWFWVLLALSISYKYTIRANLPNTPQ